VPLLPRAPRGRGDVWLHTNTFAPNVSLPRLDDQLGRGNATAESEMKAMTGLVFFVDGCTVQVNPPNQFPFAVLF
jgi:hypothetical protein